MQSIDTDLQSLGGGGMGGFGGGSNNHLLLFVSKLGAGTNQAN